jgi:hypothetical protein
MRSILLAASMLVAACTFDGNPVPGDDEPPPEATYLGCRDALEAGQTASGVYSIDPGDGLEPFDAYCDQSTDGGGWTLAIKADGNQPTFAYDAPLWSSGAPYNPDRPDRDLTEAKLASFARLPADEILLVSTSGGSLSKNLIGDFPLVERFSSGVPELLLGGLQPWLQLVPGSKVATCEHLDAVNFGDDRYRVRVGLLSRDDDDDRCDSDFSAAIGLGLEINETCDDDDTLSTITVGSIYDGCEAIASFVYLYVR